jgi:phage tail-like protein
MTATASFLYLNRDNRWRWSTAHRHGLTVGEDGTLRLDALPILDGDLPPEIAGLAAPGAPAGVAATPDGTVFFSDPDNHVLWRLDACDGNQRLVPCAGGLGDAPGRLQQPRGLLYHAGRQALMVVDSANHRVQLFNIETFQLVDIWGGWGYRPGRFKTPWAIAGDAAGNVYVVEYGKQRVQKFDALGRVQPWFAWTVRRQARQHALALYRPVDVAVGTNASGADEVYILDAEARAVFVFGSDGIYSRSIALHSDSASISDALMGLAVVGDTVYVGDNGERRILGFKSDNTFVGAAIGFAGPVAALASDGRGGLWVHPGRVPAIHDSAGIAGSSGCCDALAVVAQASGAWRGPMRLAAAGGYGARGFMWVGPFQNPSTRVEQWHRISADLDSAAEGSHFDLFVYSAPSTQAPEVPTDPGEPPWEAKVHRVELLDCLKAMDDADNLDARENSCRRRWVRIPPDAPECMIPGRPSDNLWIGVDLRGEGRSSPVLSQIRIDFDHATWLQHLPAIYQDDHRSRHFLARFLTLYEGLFGDVESEINRLPAYFDAEAVPPGFLDWLGRWLALDMSEAWEAARKRRLIRQAFALYAQRGTAEGLRAMVRQVCGVDVRIEEPIQHAAWWSLASEDATAPLLVEQSLLGFSTMLAEAEPQGAVVGSSALLDGSHLITNAEYGAPLFEDLAHRFGVLMYRGSGFSAAKRDEVLALIDRERPAHTDYHLCLVEPHMRVGYQARVGVDSIIAGPPGPTTLEDPDAAGGLVLGGDLPGRIGENGRIGQTTRLNA